MADWFDHLADENARTALGRRLERLTEEIFNVLRWGFMVGVTRFLSLEGASPWFTVIHWAMSAMLFAYLASLFLLRPEVPVFANPDKPWKRRTQTLVNLGLCLAAFVLATLGLNHLVDGAAQYRFGVMAQ